ncbi:DegT/DnrJ/EryC1/StrS family aminotransferase [Gammaproteobacteria bacterium]|nr:DegT/DnrJ/EryC1/StrS family aminotransferase [Gammaproteobacteria bacterium]
MNDFKAESPELKEQMLDAVARVIDSGWYVLGKEVEAFEHQWAKVCGVSCAIGTGNGMDAIEIALRSLDIGPGDEVITTPMTAFATVLAIIRAGAIPVLADIDVDTALLSRDSVSRCISSKTKAVVLVHLYGQVRDMNEWVQFCEWQHIHLLEDCAQSHLATWQERVAGNFGKVGAYSFYPTKNLGALGDGGALVTNDCELAERAKQLRNYGQRERYLHPKIGLNSRLDEIHAAMLQVRIKSLSEYTLRRQAIAYQYSHGIDHDRVNLLAAPQETAAHVYHLYVINCEQRDALQKHLESCEIQTLCHYPVPIHHQESCKNIRRDPEGLPRSEWHAKTCLTLPCHPQMSDEDVKLVLDAIDHFKG